MFVWDFENDPWWRFWIWNLIKICLITCDSTWRSFNHGDFSRQVPLVWIVCQGDCNSSQWLGVSLSSRLVSELCLCTLWTLFRPGFVRLLYGPAPILFFVHQTLSVRCYWSYIDICFAVHLEKRPEIQAFPRFWGFFTDARIGRHFCGKFGFRDCWKETWSAELNPWVRCSFGNFYFTFYLIGY